MQQFRDSSRPLPAMVLEAGARQMRENTHPGGSNVRTCHPGDSDACITWDNAAATAAMLRLLIAATQMRPESTP